jgi:hypothetical protein
MAACTVRDLARVRSVANEIAIEHEASPKGPEGGIEAAAQDC